MWRHILLLIIFAILGCTSMTLSSSPPLLKEPSINYSSDSLDVFVILPNDYPNSSIFINSVLHHSPDAIRNYIAKAFEEDSLDTQYLDSLPEAFYRYTLIQMYDMPAGEKKYTFSVPKAIIQQALKNIAATQLTVYPETIYPLFQKEMSLPGISVYDSLRLPLPCEGAPVPDNPLLLPNAPRSYRNGTHRGIDFYANWGSSVRSVADGVVIRAEHNYKEIPAAFREELLKETTQVGRTPSDIFEHILVGQAVYIDHGFDLIPGYRCVSIYAHLSYIEEDIVPGAKVKQEQLLGKSGNTGTRPSTIGTRGGSHLHWELILQDAGGEYYLGQGIETGLYDLLTTIFY